MTKRWNTIKRDYDENENADNFLKDIIELSKKYGLQLSHEDGHGAFQIEQYDGKTDEWLNAAHLTF